MVILSSATARCWMSDQNPSIFEESVELGNFWKNAQGSLYFCSNGVSGSQVWDELPTIRDVLSLIQPLQADWTQADSDALGFIKNKPDPRSQSNVARSLNSGFQISITRDALVSYSVDVSCLFSLTTGQSGTLFLEIASDSNFTTDLQVISRFTNANSGELTMGSSLTQTVTGQLNGYVPAGYYCRIRTVNEGDPIYSYQSGQEVLL